MTWLVLLASVLLGALTMSAFMIHSARKIAFRDEPAGPGGDAPSPQYPIKGNESSMLYHTPDSPYYHATSAQVWFGSEEDARRAGFAPWRNLS